MDDAPRGFRRNFILLVINYVAFGIGLVLFSGSAVVPLFLRRLTHSTPLIGFASILFPLCWFIPQLAAARWIANKPRRKPYIVYPSIATPLVFVALATALFLADAGRPFWLIPVFMVCIATLGLCDGLVGVPWLDFIGAAIPRQVRGRMMGLQELLSAGAALGAGALVTFLLSDAAPPFPRNFAWLAVSAGACMAVALLSFTLLREPARAGVAERQPTWREYGAALRRILRSDRVFVRLIVLRVLNGLSQLALPFYVLYAVNELGMSASVGGFFITVQMISAALGSMSLGYVYERRGSRLVIILITLLGLGAPLAALAAPLTGLSGPALRWFFALVFVSNGVGPLSGATLFIGYTNFVLEYCAPADRPIYLGLAGTLAGPTTLAAILGGLILQAAGYRILFLLTLGILLIAQTLAFGLPEPRRRALEPGS